MDRDRWQSLEPLLDEALDLPADQRQKWLVELREHSPELADDLVALLSRDEEAEAGGFLKEQPYATLEGLQVGSYTLERPIGEGGMGTVWLARRSDGRFAGSAAVKLLNLSRVNASGLRRFQQEGSALSRLTHPGIGRLLDAGVTSAGQPYLVLEYIEGEPIDQYAARRALTTTDRLRIFLQVLDAVSHAHANLIVHRDIKPSNILVTSDGTVKLLDFGVAKLLDADAAGGPAPTLEGSQALTPRYASPEQLRGDPVSTATDVYSLGVLLYQLLSGRHPTAEDSKTPADIMRAVLEKEAPPLGLGDLDAILNQALRKAITERYQGVAAFRDDILRYLEHEPVKARGASFPYHARKFVRRHRVGLAVGTLVVAGLLASTVYAFGQRREAVRQRDAAIRERELSDAQVEFQNILLSSAGDKPLTMREILDAGRAVLEKQYGNAGHTLLQLTRQLAESYSALGDPIVSDSLLTRAESLAVALPSLEDMPEIRCQQGNALRLQGQYAEAWQRFATAESLLAEHPSQEAMVYCLGFRSQLGRETDKPEEGLADIRRAIAIMDSMGKTREAGYITLLDGLASSLASNGQSRAAIPIYQREIAAWDSSGRGGTLDRSVARHNMAVVLTKMGETREAEEILHEVMVDFSRSSDEEHINWQPLIHYAEAALSQGHADSAYKYFDIVVRQALEEKNLYWEGRGLFGRGRSSLVLGRLDEARRAGARLGEILRVYRHAQDTDDVFPDDESIDGWLALAKGDTAAAIAAFRSVMVQHGYFEGKGQRRLRYAAFEVARGLIALNQADSALALLKQVRAEADADSMSTQRSLWSGRAQFIEGQALVARGDTVAGRRAIEASLTPQRVGGGADHPWVRETEAVLSRIPSSP